MSIVDLLRHDLRGFGGYESARSQAPDVRIAEGAIWLNANESPWPSVIDVQGRLRRYPQPQPSSLRTAMAALYGCAPEQLLIARGSDEAIDLLVRGFCMPGSDAALVTPPVFGMYGVCVKLHGARLIEVPLQDGRDFQLDLDAIGRIALAERAKLIFLCSPGNPAGGVLSPEAILTLAREVEGHALVVVDEAYVEFADARSIAGLVGAQSNIAVLRTLSKAHALAAARIGCLIADSRIIAALRRCQAPYPIPEPCAARALEALAPDCLAMTERRIAEVRIQREWLRGALGRTAGVRHVYPSQSNFLLVRFADADAALNRLLDADIVVRDMRTHPQLQDALRITVGRAEHNQSVLSALQPLAEVA